MRLARDAVDIETTENTLLRKWDCVTVAVQVALKVFSATLSFTKVGVLVDTTLNVLKNPRATTPVAVETMDIALYSLRVSDGAAVETADFATETKRTSDAAAVETASLIIDTRRATEDVPVATALSSCEKTFFAKSSLIALALIGDPLSSIRRT